MLRWPIRVARSLIAALRSADSPHELALGLALGMLVGLVPKDNLTACVLSTLLLALRCNLAAAVGGALVFSWLGVLIDPLSHRLGLALLELSALRPLWTWLIHLPLAPWTALNNSVVLGSLLLGIGLFYPVYRGARPAFAWSVPRLAEYLRRGRYGQLLLGPAALASGETP